MRWLSILNILQAYSIHLGLTKKTNILQITVSKHIREYFLHLSVIFKFDRTDVIQLTNTDSGNGLSSDRRYGITSTNIEPVFYSNVL